MVPLFVTDVCWVEAFGRWLLKRKDFGDTRVDTISEKEEGLLYSERESLAVLDGVR
jgi:hypothetical protein